MLGRLRGWMQQRSAKERSEPSPDAAAAGVPESAKGKTAPAADAGKASPSPSPASSAAAAPAGHRRQATGPHAGDHPIDKSGLGAPDPSLCEDVFVTAGSMLLQRGVVQRNQVKRLASDVCDEGEAAFVALERVADACWCRLAEMQRLQSQLGDLDAFILEAEEAREKVETICYRIEEAELLLTAKLSVSEQKRLQHWQRTKEQQLAEYKEDKLQRLSSLDRKLRGSSVRSVSLHNEAGSDDVDPSVDDDGDVSPRAQTKTAKELDDDFQRQMELYREKGPRALSQSSFTAPTKALEDVSLDNLSSDSEDLEAFLGDDDADPA